MALATDRLVFVHVPKTGGNTVRRFLAATCGPVREAGGFHDTLAQVLSAEPGLTNGRVSFGFVRYPVEWFKSAWAFGRRLRRSDPTCMQTRGIFTDKIGAGFRIAACWSDDLERFVSNFLERYPGTCTEMAFSRLGLRPGEQAVDFVGRTENWAADMARVLGEAGVPFNSDSLATMPRQNVSDSERHTLPQSLVTAIEQTEAELIARFYT